MARLVPHPHGRPHRSVHVIDVRTIAPAQRHSQIFATFDALPAGGALELVNDHDPVPLYFQFEKMRPGQFRWITCKAALRCGRCASAASPPARPAP